VFDGLKLTIRYQRASVRGQMQYRASFAMSSLAILLSSGIEFLGIWALFDRFGNLRGWTLPEVALFYGLVSTAWFIAEGYARGFDTFSGAVRSGEFDRVLLRPRATALQVAGREVQLVRVGGFAQGLLALVWAGMSLRVAWTLPRLALTIATVIGGACLFTGLIVLQATLCFWTVDTLEIVNTVTHGGRETGQYPLTIYRDWFRRFFTYAVPLACVTYFPALTILGRTDPLGTSRLFQASAPLGGVAFLFVALQVWKIGVRHYRSTGS
jgi:ABC-2 type transport system permease protein